VTSGYRCFACGKHFSDAPAFAFPSLSPKVFTLDLESFTFTFAVPLTIFTLVFAVLLVSSLTPVLQPLRRV
jgi:hypothetical protein